VHQHRSHKRGNVCGKRETFSCSSEQTMRRCCVVQRCELWCGNADCGDDWEFGHGGKPSGVCAKRERFSKRFSYPSPHLLCVFPISPFSFLHLFPFLPASFLLYF
jgi:hypothetical protein